MPRNSLCAPARFLLGLFSCLLALQAGAAPKTLPEAVIRAHTLFLENDTGFHELEYSTIFELNKWGRFELAESREQADLVLRLDNGNHVRAVPEGQFPSTGDLNSPGDAEIPKGHTRISLLDPKTNAILWSDTHKTDGGKVKGGHLLDGLREAFDNYEKTHR